MSQSLSHSSRSIHSDCLGESTLKVDSMTTRARLSLLVPNCGGVYWGVYLVMPKVMRVVAVVIMRLVMEEMVAMMLTTTMRIITIFIAVIVVVVVIIVVIKSTTIIIKTILIFTAASIWFENWGSWVLKVQQKKVHSQVFRGIIPGNLYLI